MKKTLVSLAAVAALTTGAMAADKGIDFVTTGQAVVYYETTDATSDIFKQAGSTANFAVQLNNDADLGNGFAFGSQLTHLSTAGLQYNVVDGVRQGGVQGGEELVVTKMNIAKKVGNTTVKLGRQELPKSLSPLAFSEKWNVVKNTFDATLIINSDLPKTTLVFAAVDNSNMSKGSTGLSDRKQLQAAGATVDGAFMLTAQTTLIPLTTITGSYYALGTVNAGLATDDKASAVWVDAKLADKSLPMGLKIGLQGGSITPADTNLKATTAMGAKLGLAPVDGLNLCLAYSTVDDGTVALKNTGTGVKTPLYTQLILNQNYISSDNSTIMVQGAYSLGDAGKVIARASVSTDNSAAATDTTGIEAIYKTKVSGFNLMVAYLNYTTGDADAKQYVRVVGRYNF